MGVVNYRHQGNNLMDIFSTFTDAYKSTAKTTLSFTEYLDLCKNDHITYATASERMVAAIGTPTLVDTSADPRLSIIHQNRTIKVYEPFKDFYGIEAAIEKIVAFFIHAAQGLEEKKQVLYLLGPVGSSKSSIAERLKVLMEAFPIYTLGIVDANGEIEVSPVYESPLGLFDPVKFATVFQEQYGIHARYLTGLMSPWAIKRLDELNGDISKFVVVRVQPSKLRQIGVMKTEPGDDNNQDITTLVGKTDMHKLEHFSQNDPDAYSFSGGLNRTTQGLLEFVEMFKAPIKVLHPLLTATQEGNYVGSEAISAIPFQGIILAHSNQTEWTTFRNNKNNEAFLDRVCVIKIPYCLQMDEEQKIYEKMLSTSALKNSACAPKTLGILAEFAVLSRLVEHENSNLYSKRSVYNGENVKDSDPKAKSIQEYRDAAGVDEGMTGISTRFCFKVLSDTFNRDIEETAADPVHLMDVLITKIVQEQFPKEQEAKLIDFVKTGIAIRYLEFIGKEIRSAYIEHADDYGQTIFDRYIALADCWIERNDYKDPDTHTMLNHEMLNVELESIEKAAGISNPKDFRNEVVKYALRARATNNGQNPRWTAYNKIKEVIEKKMFSSLDEMIPVISFESKKTKQDDEKHASFVTRMEEKGYTARQTRRLVDWYFRVQRSS